LLGGGIIEAAPRQLYGTTVLWTNQDAPGLRDEAKRLGYGGGAAMIFLPLRDSVFPAGSTPPALPTLGTLDTGLNELSPGQANSLAAYLPIP
jgi:hypothetical protein